NNITTGTAVVSYYITENPINDSTYKPLPADIYIHDNYYERPKVKATGKGRMGKMFRFKLRCGKDVPHILYDVIGTPATRRNICIRNNQNATFANIDAENGFKNISNDMKPHDCEGKRIPPVTLNAKQD